MASEFPILDVRAARDHGQLAVTVRDAEAMKAHVEESLPFFPIPPESIILSSVLDDLIVYIASPPTTEALATEGDEEITTEADELIFEEDTAIAAMVAQLQAFPGI